MKARLHLGAPNNENRSVRIRTRRKGIEPDVITGPVWTLDGRAFPTTLCATLTVSSLPTFIMRVGQGGDQRPTC